MDLTTGFRITRHKIRTVPLTLLVKNKVEELAKTQGITNMKFTNKKGDTLPQADLIAGADYDVLSGEEDQNEENEIENDEEPNEEPIIQVVNQTHGELVEEEEEVEVLD